MGSELTSPQLESQVTSVDEQQDDGYTVRYLEDRLIRDRDCLVAPHVEEDMEGDGDYESNYRDTWEVEAG